MNTQGMENGAIAMKKFQSGVIVSESSSFSKVPIHMRCNKATLLFIILIVNSGCSSWLFHPMYEHKRTPEALGLQYQNIFLQSVDGTRIHAWLLPAQGELKGSVYFLHGNAENISTHIASVHWLPQHGYQVLLLDYRGFGLSAGKPDVPEVLLDIDIGFLWLIDHADNQPVYILGQSLGASLAIYFAAHSQAAEKNLAGLISDAAFTSYYQISKDVAARHWLTWLLQYPIAWAMDYPFNPRESITLLPSIPLLISHGKNDRIIPFKHGQQLFALANTPKCLLVSNGEHIETFMYKKNRTLLLEFLEQPDQFIASKKTRGLSCLIEGDHSL